MCCSVCGTNHKRSGRLPTPQHSGTHESRRVYPMVPWNAPLEIEFHSESRPSSEQKGDRCAELSARNSKCRSGKYLFSGCATLLLPKQITTAGFILVVVHLSVMLAASATLPRVVSPRCCPDSSALEKLSQETTTGLRGAEEAKEEEPSKGHFCKRVLARSSLLRSSLSRSLKTKSPCENCSDGAPRGFLSHSLKTKSPGDSRVDKEDRGYPRRNQVEWIATCTLSDPEAPCKSLSSKGQNNAETPSNDMTEVAVTSNDNGDVSSARNDDAVSPKDVKPSGNASKNVNPHGFLHMASTLLRRNPSHGSSIKRDRHGKGEAQTKRTRSFLRRGNSLPKQSSDRESPVHCTVSAVEDKNGLHPDGSGASKQDAPTRRAPRVKRRSKTMTLAESFLSFIKEKRDFSSSKPVEKDSLRGLLRRKPKSKAQDLPPESVSSTDETSASSRFKEPSNVDTAAETTSAASSAPPKSVTYSPITNRGAVSANELQTQKPSQEPSHAKHDTTGEPCGSTVSRDEGGLSASKKLEFIDVESGDRLGNLTLLGTPLPWCSSQGAVLPMKIQLGSTSYICFTLQTLNSALEKADQKEMIAILQALHQNKKILLDSASRLDAACNSSCSQAVWCVPVKESDAEKSPQGTFVLVGCEHVKYGSKAFESH